jgi:two-component system OmpR family sensor kinase
VKLAARLWLLGALAPTAGMLAAVFVGAHFFRGELEVALDQALLSQAAIEAVSLFDGPDGKPHLHIEGSSLGDLVARFTPAAALFGPDGHAVIRYPVGSPGMTDEALVPGPPGGRPQLSTRQGPSAGRRRVLVAFVPGPKPDKAPYALQLAASLDAVDRGAAEFRRLGLLVAAGMGAALLGLQSVLAFRLSARVNRLTRHMAALREGHLEVVAPDDRGRDEIGALSRGVAEATERLRAARAAQERLIADAAHELRTPLTLMRTSIDLALRRRAGVGELKAALEDARREVDRLAGLATRLLDLAAAGRGQWDRRPGDLVQVAQEAAEAIRAEAEVRGVLVVVEGPGELPAPFDASGIRQALDNLLSNAVRFSPPGEVVTVRLSAEAGVARAAVVDRGPGIPPQERERLFEPFERGRIGPTGAGLGLAIAREIAFRHGGRAYAAEPPGGRGAVVVLEIPARA